MKIGSPAFGNGEAIPSKYSCRGGDISPPLEFSDIPTGTKSLVLIMDDPDAPRGTWVHWLLWNIQPGTTAIKEDSVPASAVQGSNSWGKNQYGGPCPPSGTHRYFFKLYALDIVLDTHTMDAQQLEKAMEGHVLGNAALMGKFG